MMAAAELAEMRTTKLRASGAQLHPSKYRPRGGDGLRTNAGWAEFAGRAVLFWLPLVDAKLAVAFVELDAEAQRDEAELGADGGEERLADVAGE
jgi:hypothetical protein